MRVCCKQDLANKSLAFVYWAVIVRAEKDFSRPKGGWRRVNGNFACGKDKNDGKDS